VYRGTASFPCLPPRLTATPQNQHRHGCNRRGCAGNICRAFRLFFSCSCYCGVSEQPRLKKIFIVIHYRKHKAWPSQWFISKLNMLITMYVVGILLGQTGMSKLSPVKSALDLLSQASVALSLPLLLFGADLLALRKTGWKVGAAMVLGSVSMFISSSVAHLALGSGLGDDSPLVGGIITAICSGGTQNGASVAAALDIDTSLYIATHTSEVIIGAIYVLLMMTVTKPLLDKFMPAYIPIAQQDCQRAAAAKKTSAQEAGAHSIELTDYQPVSAEAGPPNKLPEQESPSAAGVAVPDPLGPERSPSLDSQAPQASEGNSDALLQDPAMRLRAGIELFVELWDRKFLKSSLTAAGLALLIVGVSAGVPMLFPSDAQRDFGTLVTILMITTASIACSFSPRVRAIPHTYTLGQYVILVFALSVGMLASIEELVHTSPLVFAFVLIAMVLGIVLHVASCWALGIDGDTLMVASISNICSPPFVPLAINATKNNELLVPGISVGLLGYAYGTYLGIGLAVLWQNVSI